MKRILLILAFVLAFLLKGSNAACDEQMPVSSGIVSVCDTDTFSPASTSSYSAETQNYGTSFRNSGQGRRLPSSMRSAYRVLKDGKVIDKSFYSTFRELYIEFYSGIHSNVRYIYSIRHLLI